MKRVIQEHEVGCGVACLAMLAGITFQEAAVVMFPNGRIRPARTSDIKRAAKTLGIDAGARRRSLGKRDYRDLREDALLSVKFRNTRWWHWVVWDSRNKQLLDPRDPPYERPPIISFLTVSRPSAD
jgi:ABC-type bacteriocin/lantibiotic exporter with double-glycine peptidase domain